MRLILLAGGALAAALSLTAPAAAQWYGPGDGYGPGYGYDYDYGPSYGYPGGGYGYGPGPGVVMEAPAAGPRIFEGRSSAVDTGQGSDAVGYCEQRFRSYDPETGTYLGYDGQRHSCP